MYNCEHMALSCERSALALESSNVFEITLMYLTIETKHEAMQQQQIEGELVGWSS